VVWALQQLCWQIERRDAEVPACVSSTLTSLPQSRSAIQIDAGAISGKIDPRTSWLNLLACRQMLSGDGRFGSSDIMMRQSKNEKPCSRSMTSTSTNIGRPRYDLTKLTSTRMPRMSSSRAPAPIRISFSAP
jgi:hypothetical protein